MPHLRMWPVKKAKLSMHAVLRFHEFLFFFCDFLHFFSLQNQGDSNRYDGQDSKQAPFIDKETKYSSKTRKPFHYNTLKDPLQTSNDQELAAKYNRYRYISKLSGHTVVRLKTSPCGLMYFVGC